MFVALITSHSTTNHIDEVANDDVLAPGLLIFT
jgi:hypothetical protein